MKKIYGSTIWEMLQEYAIWQPGDHTELGDFGVIDEGCFKRIGNIREYITDININTKTNVLDQVSFRSDSTVKRLPGLKGLVTFYFEFKKKNGIILSARDVEVNTFLELQKAARLIASIENWDRSWFVVTSVRNAGKFVLIISKDLSVSIQGNEKEVEDLIKGDPGINSSAFLTGSVSLKMIGEKGPLSVRLHQLKSRGDSFKHLEQNNKEIEEWVLAPNIDGVPES